MFLLWWLTSLPRLFIRRAFRTDELTGVLEVTRNQRTNDLARDGTLMLTVTVAVAYALAGNEAAMTVLAFVFLGVWVLLLGVSWGVKGAAGRFMAALEFTGMAILVVAMAVAFATS